MRTWKFSHFSDSKNRALLDNGENLMNTLEQPLILHENSGENMSDLKAISLDFWKTSPSWILFQLRWRLPSSLVIAAVASFANFNKSSSSLHSFLFWGVFRPAWCSHLNKRFSTALESVGGRIIQDGCSGVSCEEQKIQLWSYLVHWFHDGVLLLNKKNPSWNDCCLLWSNMPLRISL